jgi:MFS family permease
VSSLPPKGNSQLPDQIRAAGWVSFFTDIASEMIYPVIPLFLVGTLKAPAAALGLIEGLAQALINVMRAVSGWHSDRIGKRTPYVRLGYGISAMSRPLLALAGTWPLVLVARLMDRFGKGVRTTARDALIADASPVGGMGRAFGYHRAMDSAGAVVGSGIGWLMLLVLPGQYRLMFLLTVVPAFVAVWITFKLRETGPTIDRNEYGTRPNPWAGVKTLGSRFWMATFIMSLFALANSSDAFLLLRANDMLASAPLTALAYVTYNASYATLSYPFGTLSDRIGKLPLLLAGWTVYAIVYFGFAQGIPWSTWLLMPLYGLYMAMTDGVSKALVADLSPPRFRGTAMGVFYFSTGTAALVASVVAGELWDHIGHASPFLIGGMLAIGSTALAAFFFRRVQGNTPNSGLA